MDCMSPLALTPLVNKGSCKKKALPSRYFFFFHLKLKILNFRQLINIWTYHVKVNITKVNITKLTHVLLSKYVVAGDTNKPSFFQFGI